MPFQRSPAPEPSYRQYTVSRKHREPLVRFILGALESKGCRIIQTSSPELAPFKISFETAEGERMGILAYAFYANNKLTRNRPDDEYRFQLKYGSKTGGEHELWQDPYGLYTTLLMGVSPEEEFFVGFDPVLHSPTKHFISLEFKESFVEEVQNKGWAQEERQRQSRGFDEPVEVVVGGKPSSILDYIRFEREAVGEDQGHRALLAENRSTILRPSSGTGIDVAADAPYVHALASELELSPDEVLDLINNARRLKMAVRGWVAEEHLVRRLTLVDGVTDCERKDDEGGPDIQLRFEGSDLLTVECKNVMRKMNAGLPHVDFQRTRTSKGDPCTRFYSAKDFDVLAACLHALTQKWEYSFALTKALARHKKCPGKLANKVLVDEQWSREIRGILGQAARG
ncbi:MAG: hypothetical protein ABI837_13765 [Acidobacteriota bacterium]